MASFLLPSISTTRLGTFYDFVIGDDGRQGGPSQVTVIDVDDPVNERISWTGMTGTQLTGKVTGGTIRLMLVNTSFGIAWLATGIAGVWELADGNTGSAMVLCGEVYSVVKKDQQESTTDVLANVTGLSLPYRANGGRPFHFSAFVPFQTDGLSGFNFNMDCGVPSQYSAQMTVVDVLAGLVKQHIDVGVPTQFADTLPNELTCLKIEGIIENGSGVLQLQFAQQVPDIAALIIFPFASLCGWYN